MRSSRIWVAVIVIFSIHTGLVFAQQVQRAGRVLTAQNQPSAGARVYLIEGSSETSKPAITTTDPQGRFSFPAAATGRSILVQAEGYGLGGASVAEQVDDPVEIRLAEATAVKVKVVGPDDKPVSNVRMGIRLVRGRRLAGFAVFLPAELSQSLSKTTDSEGVCVFPSLPRGAIVRLDVLDDRFAHYSNRSDINLADGPESDGGTIKLQLAANVMGRVVIGESGKPVAGVRVGAQGVGGESGWSEAVTDEQGRYQLKQLSTGQYNVALDLRDELAKQYTAVAVEKLSAVGGEDMQGADFKLIPGVTITGKAFVRGTNRPLPGLSIGVYGPAHPRSGAWVQNTSTAEDGTYTLRVPPGAQYVYFQSIVPPGLIRPEPRSHEFELAEGQTQTVDFEFGESPLEPVTGRVVDGEGKPVARARVTFEAREGMLGDSSGPATTDDQGNFKLLGVPNRSRIRAVKGDARTEQAQIVSPGDDNITLIIRKIELASALVRVVQPDGKPLPNAKIDLSEMTGSFGLGIDSQTTGPDGTVTFKSLTPDSQYNIQASAKGFGVAETALKLEPGKQFETSITLDKADSFIAGMVLNEAGDPMIDVQVETTGGRGGRQVTKTDVNGRFRLENIVPSDSPYVYVRHGDQMSSPQRIPAATDNAIINFKPAATRRGG